MRDLFRILILWKAILILLSLRLRFREEYTLSRLFDSMVVSEHPPTLLLDLRGRVVEELKIDVAKLDRVD